MLLVPEQVHLLRHRRHPQRTPTSNPARMTYPTTDAGSDADANPARCRRIPTGQPGRTETKREGLTAVCVTALSIVILSKLTLRIKN